MVKCLECLRLKYCAEILMDRCDVDEPTALTMLEKPNKLLHNYNDTCEYYIGEENSPIQVEE